MLGLLFPGSAEADVGCGANLNNDLIASCIISIFAKNYQNLVTGFQVTIENAGDVFFGTQCASGHISETLRYRAKVTINH